MQSLHFNFTNLDDKDFKTLVNAKNYLNILNDFAGWLNKEIQTSEYYDNETLKYIQDKLIEIGLNYKIDI
jgi:hypothetical protein